MNQEKPADLRESLSALVDGEASEWDIRKTLQQSDGDQDLREDWAAYQQISAVLRKESVQGVDISSAVMSALDEEPAHNKFKYFSKAFGQTAIAASVAVVALIGIQQYQIAENEVTGETSIAETAVQSEMTPVAQPPAGFEFQPVTRAVSSSATEPSLTQGTSVQIPVDRDQVEAHLDTLVQEHSKNSVQSSQAVMPMVRVPASSEAE